MILDAEVVGEASSGSEAIEDAGRLRMWVLMKLGLLDRVQVVVFANESGLYRRT